MLQTLDRYHKILKNENLKAAPDKSFFVLDSIRFLGNQIQNNQHLFFTKRINLEN